MAKNEETISFASGNVKLDEDSMSQEVKKEIKVRNQVVKKQEEKLFEDDEPLINPLSNTRVIVKLIPRSSGLVTDPNHELYGMAGGAHKTYCTPMLRSGSYVNVLTDDEKRFFEKILGINLSVYEKDNNFWANRYVRLGKEPNYFDMSDPYQYIDVKILLANKDKICPSISELEEHPKATYQFVIVNEGDDIKRAASNMTVMQMCMKEYGKIENDVDLLRQIVETIDGRPIASNVKIEFLQGKVFELIQANAKLFLNVVEDPYLKTKVFIKKALEAGVVQKRNDFYYYEGQPLCEAGEDSTLSMASKFLNLPKHQEVKFSIQAKLS